MSFLTSLGGAGGALGGLLGGGGGGGGLGGMVGGPMSGIGMLGKLFGGGGGGGDGAPAAPEAAPAPQQVNPMASGLGKMIGAEGGQVSNFADKLGGGMNQIAAAGGATPGYAPPAVGGPQTGPMPAPNNHLQLLDDDVLQSLVARFRPNGRGQNQMEQF